MRKFSVWSIKNHRSAAVKVACAVCAPPGSARETGLKSSRVFCINNKNNNRFTRQDHCIIQSQFIGETKCLCDNCLERYRL